MKISHHGSTNGYCEGLWQHFTKDKNTVGAITPYCAQGLPSKEAIAHILRYAHRLLITNRNCTGLLDAGAAQPTVQVWEDWDLAVRLAARGAFHSFVVHESDEFGICSFEFAGDGTLSRITCDGAADVVKLQP